MSRDNIKLYFSLHGILLLYSLGGIVSKTAASKPFLSVDFMVLYSIVILNLGLYAILWQKILKKMSLTAAFANKSIVIIWGVIWGKLVFDEVITITQIIGVIIILIGILIVVKNNE